MITVADPDVMNCRNYAERFLRRFRHTTYTADDLAQDCWVAYLEGRGFYYRRMVDAMRLWHEAGPGWQGNKFRNTCSILYAHEKVDSHDIERAAIDQELADMIDIAIERLSPKEKFVAIRTWRDGLRGSKIAAEMGCSYTAVWRLRTSALLRIKRWCLNQHREGGEFKWSQWAKQ